MSSILGYCDNCFSVLQNLDSTEISLNLMLASSKWKIENHYLSWCTTERSECVTRYKRCIHFHFPVTPILNLVVWWSSLLLTSECWEQEGNAMSQSVLILINQLIQYSNSWTITALNFLKPTLILFWKGGKWPQLSSNFQYMFEQFSSYFPPKSELSML